MVCFRYERKIIQPSLTQSVLMMYCLRYFLLVLLFFPFPTAPPFLVFLFLISMTVQHKPCAYCSLLLSAILLSTCSWNIASFDVSPTYSTVPTQNYTSSHDPSKSIADEDSSISISFLSSILSFFQSNDRVLTTTQSSHPTGGFESIVNSNSKDHPQPKSMNRCWCYSNSGRLFEPVSTVDLIDSEGNAIDPQAKRASNRLDRSKDNSKSQSDPVTAKVVSMNDADNQHRTSSEDIGTIDYRSSYQIVKSRGKQIKTMLSPIWKPFTKFPISRSAVTNLKASIIPSSDPVQDTRASPENNPAGPQYHPPSPSKLTSHPTPPKKNQYRSSFSRTPLVYSHCIKHLINYFRLSAKFVTTLQSMNRMMTIVYQNVSNLVHHDKLIRWVLESFRLKSNLEKIDGPLSFFRSIIDHYRLNQPYTIRLNQLVGFRIFLGSRPSL